MDTPQNNYASLKELSLGLGAGLFGVADISEAKGEFTFPKGFLDGYTYAVSLGIRVLSSVVAELDTQPTMLYFRTYRSTNTLIDQVALRIAIHLEEKGFRALPIPASQVIDWHKQTSHLSHKKIAVMAGLGWIGRNNLLVSREFGSHLRLATILTDMPLSVDAPLQEGCGQCRACVDTCPASAIKETAAEFDHAGCFAKLQEFHRKRIAEQYICGVCIRECRGKAQ